MRGKQVDGAAEVGLAHIACRARPAINHRRADGRAGKESRRVVGGVVGVAKGNAVKGDVEITV